MSTKFRQPFLFSWVARATHENGKTGKYFVDMGIYGGSIDLMKIHETDNADELERFARESKRGNGVLIGAYDGLTLAQSAKEIRKLR